MARVVETEDLIEYGLSVATNSDGDVFLTMEYDFDHTKRLRFDSTEDVHELIDMLNTALKRVEE